MSTKQNPTYRESRLALVQNVTGLIEFKDTRPNVLVIVSSSNTPIYVSESANVGLVTYDIIIPPFGTRVYAKPANMRTVYFFASGANANLFVGSMEQDFDISMISQTQEITGQVRAGGILGLVNVGTIINPLPAGNQNIGSFDVNTLPAAFYAALLAQASEVTAAAILAKLNAGIDVALSGSNVEGTPGQAQPAKALFMAGADTSNNLQRLLVDSPGDAELASLKGALTYGRGAMFNGATWDRMRNNFEGTLLASAERTATASSPNQTNFNAKGIMIFVRVSAKTNAPSITPKIFTVDPVSGLSDQHTQFTAISDVTNNLKMFLLYPGAAETIATAFIETQAMPIPRTWKLTMSHGNADPITYSVGYSYIL